MSESAASDHSRAAEPPGEADRDELMRLAAEVAHQIKAPLSTIQTILGTLMGGFAGPLEPRQRWLLEKAVERCGHGVKIVRDLMKLRSLGTLADESLGPVNLARAFTTVCDAHRDAAGARELEFETHLEIEDHALAWVHGEENLVGEVISVLLDNAIKYTPRGGRVTASLSREPDAEGRGALLHITVTDTGIGIPPEGYARLFHEFYRAPSARRLSTEGSGLGLAFAFRAARRLGATLDLCPSPSGGVQARASFPFCPKCADRALRSATAPGASRRARPVSRRVVIVGGVAAGPKTAARILRLDPDAEVTIVERGRFLAYSGCALPYYVSGVVADQARLLETSLGAMRDSSFFHELKNVRTLEMTEAVAIDRTKKTVRVRSLDCGERDLPYDQLVLATGGRTVRPEVPGVDLAGIYTLQGIPDAEALRAELRTPQVKDVVIVGGGLLGCQITEAIAMRGARISLVEGREHLLRVVDPEIAMMTRRHLERHGVRVLTRATVAGFDGEERVSEVALTDGRRLACDFVVLAAGIRPEVALGAAAGLEVGPTGAYAVDRHLRTSDPDIYAVGDCSEHPHLVAHAPSWFPGAAAAAIQGRTAAANVCGLSETYPGSLGTIVVKLFDATVARTGLTVSEAREAGFDPVSVIVPGLDHAHFLPDAQIIVVKLLADRRTQRLLGAQAFGRGDVAKRIDVAATALAAGFDVDALAHHSLGYAPHCALAIDVVVAAANVLGNKLDGRYDGVAAADLRDQLVAPEPPALVDVRLPAEFEMGHIPGSRHVPLGVLRSRLDELSRDRPIVLVCSFGLRSYEASLILRANGFQRVSVLDGGIDAWPYEFERLG